MRRPRKAMGLAMDLEMSVATLNKALSYVDGSKSGLPPYNPVTMFNAPLLAARQEMVRRI